MFSFTSAILILIFLGGLARLVSIFGQTIASLPEPERAIQKRRTFVAAITSMVAAPTGLVALWSGFSDPLESVVGVLLITGFVEIANRFVTPRIRPRPPCIARDIETGESLGEVVGERREWSRGRIEGFKIRTSQGDLIERSSDSITIESR
jgi:hypothetical protein